MNVTQILGAEKAVVGILTYAKIYFDARQVSHVAELYLHLIRIDQHLVVVSL
jgi:hypothetical protein